jgi:formylglycine-generating enzyme required for sulfatase activity
MTPEPDRPKRIGKYELEEFLGGGMSHVYRARDTIIGRTVAVKILTEAGCQDEEAKARFLAEARMAGNIEHDNVLSIYDFGQDEAGKPFMVMEFLRGEDLRHAIRDGHTGDITSRLKIALQIARALQYIHTQKIIHRDIKPENVHITNSGVVKLMDFGIAKTEGLAMTRAGYVLGTPYYMAPEQVMGQQVTEQVDVYAFGILLFELITGNKPISGDSVERIFYAILNEPLSLEPLQGCGAPQAVCDLIARCTMKNPADRPQGFAPICADIERMILETEAPTVMLPEAGTMTPQPPPVKPMPKWLIPAIVGLVLVLIGVFYLVMKQKYEAAHIAQGGTSGATGATSAPLTLPKTLALPSGEMVLVPAGAFLFGEKKDPVQLHAFYIDRTEVTNGAYADFCSKTGHALPQGFPTDKPDYPVVNVSYDDAAAFAAWAGKRMPTGSEWEKAARGDQGWLYPWGDERDPARANIESKVLRPAGDYPQGASDCGALNMIGNVWEWVNVKGSPNEKVLANFRFMKATAQEPWFSMRGAAFDSPWAQAVIYDEATIPARLTAPDIGFRCARDAP